MRPISPVANFYFNLKPTNEQKPSAVFASGAYTDKQKKIIHTYKRSVAPRGHVRETSQAADESGFASRTAWITYIMKINHVIRSTGMLYVARVVLFIVTITTSTIFFRATLLQNHFKLRVTVGYRSYPKACANSNIYKIFGQIIIIISCAGSPWSFYWSGFEIRGRRDI